jgi:hypothetical protein
MRDTIELAREAGLYRQTHYLMSNPVQTRYSYEGSEEQLKAFEALVRADQDERYKWDIHSCGPTCKRYACVAMREAVEAEREACAKLCEDNANDLSEGDWDSACINCATVIRARGNT